VAEEEKFKVDGLLEEEEGEGVAKEAAGKEGGEGEVEAREEVLLGEVTIRELSTTAESHNCPFVNIFKTSITVLLKVTKMHKIIKK